jgi:hypothetical protein
MPDDPDDGADELIREIFALPYQAPTTPPSSVRPALRRWLVDMHVQSSREPIHYPASHGAFPGDLLAVIPPVVPDANWLRNDIRYACDHDQRTVLVNATNAGLLRLFCAQHVIDEVVEHSEEWVAGLKSSRWTSSPATATPAGRTNPCLAGSPQPPPAPPGPKPPPGDRAAGTHDRARSDKIGATGTVTLRHGGKLCHIGIGRAHAGTQILLLVQDLHIRIAGAATGELLRELTLNPDRNYQPTGKPQDPTQNTPQTKNPEP